MAMDLEEVIVAWERMAHPIRLMTWLGGQGRVRL